METLQINKENAMKAHNEATGELKKALATAFGLTYANPIDIFKSYTDVCSAAGIDPVASLPFPYPKTKKHVSSNGNFKLQIIFDEFNRKEDGSIWEPDYTDNEAKYYAWFEWSPSLGALVFRLTVCTVTSAYLGARFWFEDRNTAEKFTKNNIDLINDLHRL